MRTYFGLCWLELRLFANVWRHRVSRGIKNLTVVVWVFFALVAVLFGCGAFLLVSHLASYGGERALSTSIFGMLTVFLLAVTIYPLFQGVRNRPRLESLLILPIGVEKLARFNILARVGSPIVLGFYPMMLGLGAGLLVSMHGASRWLGCGVVGVAELVGFLVFSLALAEMVEVCVLSAISARRRESVGLVAALVGIGLLTLLVAAMGGGTTLSRRLFDAVASFAAAQSTVFLPPVAVARSLTDIATDDANVYESLVTLGVLGLTGWICYALTLRGMWMTLRADPGRGARRDEQSTGRVPWLTLPGVSPRIAALAAQDLLYLMRGIPGRFLVAMGFFVVTTGILSVRFSLIPSHLSWAATVFLVAGFGGALTMGGPAGGFALDGRGVVLLRTSPASEDEILLAKNLCRLLLAEAMLVACLATAFLGTPLQPIAPLAEAAVAFQAYCFLCLAGANFASVRFPARLDMRRLPGRSPASSGSQIAAGLSCLVPGSLIFLFLTCVDRLTDFRLRLLALVGVALVACLAYRFARTRAGLLLRRRWESLTEVTAGD